MAKAFGTWYDTIHRKIEPVAVSVPVDIDMPVEALQRLEDPQVVEELLRDFTMNEFLGGGGVLEQQFRSKMRSEYYPKVIKDKPKAESTTFVSEDDAYGQMTEGMEATGDEYDAALTKRRSRQRKKKATNDQAPRVNTMQAGFEAVWAGLQQVTYQNSAQGGEVGLGPLPFLMGLRLSDYMFASGTTAKNQQLNSLFLAVEFGTGVRENVGNAAWVRGPGESDAKVEEPVGAWKFGSYVYTGQRGFHFLFDARTRKPQDYYRSRIEQRFGHYLKKHLFGSS